MSQKRPTQPVPGHYTIALLVFAGGAIGMMLELTGARVLAPYFGNSLFVWTSLIGVMLGFMSLGYFWAGGSPTRGSTPATCSGSWPGPGVSVALVNFMEGIAAARAVAREVRCGCWRCSRRFCSSRCRRRCWAWSRRTASG